MRTFKAYIKKEILESVRQYRYIILAVGLVFFAVATPIMLKLLPKLLEGQLAGDLSSLFVVTRRMGYLNYIKDLTQIGFMVVILTLSGLLSDEVSSKKLVFPYSKGSSPAQLVMAKFLHYSLITAVLIMLGGAINYYYVNLLLTGDDVAFIKVIYSTAMAAMYFMINIALVMLFSSFVKKGILAGIATLVSSFGLAGLAQIKSLTDYLPYSLMSAASTYNFDSMAKNILVALLYLALFLYLCIFRMNKVEVI